MDLASFLWPLLLRTWKRAYGGWHFAPASTSLHKLLTPQSFPILAVFYLPGGLQDARCVHGAAPRGGEAGTNLYVLEQLVDPTCTTNDGSFAQP